MRVYVETNFLLELAFEQEQHVVCEELLRLAEVSPLVHLSIPIFSLYESMDTLQRRRRERNELGCTEHASEWEPVDFVACRAGGTARPP